MEAVAGISKKYRWGVLVLLLVLIINLYGESAEAARRRRGGRGRGVRRGGAGRVAARRGRRSSFRGINSGFNNDFFDQIQALANLSQIGSAFGGFNNGLIDPSLNQFAGAGNFGLGAGNNAALALALQGGGLGIGNGLGVGAGFGGQFGFVPLSRNLVRRSDGRVFQLEENAQIQNGQLLNPQQAVGTEILAMPQNGQLLTGVQQVRAETQADIKAYNNGEKMSSVYTRGSDQVAASPSSSQDNVVSLRNRDQNL